MVGQAECGVISLFTVLADRVYRMYLQSCPLIRPQYKYTYFIVDLVVCGNMKQ